MIINSRCIMLLNTFSVVIISVKINVGFVFSLRCSVKRQSESAVLQRRAEWFAGNRPAGQQ